MSKTRVDLVKKAFAKFDRSGDGVVTVEDLKRVYQPDCHPKYKSGEWTAKQVFEHFLNAYEPDPSKRDGRVSVRK
jgi:Ca2+-binding EF-hand superfamily protein